MCDIADKFTAAGAELTIIGNGTAQQAAQTRERLKAPFNFLADPEQVSYRAANLRKDFASTFNWRTLPAALGALKRGHRQSRTKGDAFQQGGVLVIGTDGEIVFQHINRFGGDHAAPQEILAALEVNS